MNSIAESFNNWIKDIKDKEKIMELFHKRRRIACRLQGKILPAVLRVV
jgi:hypothetical protein